ncbi:uncharacterized protein PHALS_03890 [Plasmopara halstedii]|uniref:Uncharacterized protein n=1 Tax=Plasmopara halstedii TaxID=4781 RepID=A0A0N7L7J4_PLAHL|nr:uncharacterized protein PHALS_03890 [Plasmopara halstedii]CEG47243.1 hypothetical protein PHALS_03890 [Plasmopara halstedii]|eukprot:XP_024583612.1 hypothetical protein PHALS_03890 [Plasmopara halstedii]
MLIPETITRLKRIELLARTENHWEGFPDSSTNDVLRPIAIFVLLALFVVVHILETLPVDTLCSKVLGASGI